MRPYTRSLHPDDYVFLQKYNAPLVEFQRDMVRMAVPHREWHPHRFWEYASILQQLDELNVPKDANILDVGSGGSFFPPYLASRGGYPNVSLTDSMKYGDITGDVQAQRGAYDVSLPLYDLLVEDMSRNLLIGWDGASDFWDVVMCISTIEHVDADRHDDALREIWRITKPGGLIFITSDYFRDLDQFEASPSRHLQFTPYMKEFVLSLPNLIDAEFVGDTDLDYCGDFVHSYSFCNVCLRKRSPASTGSKDPDNGKG
jgi:SAM-dependent methyltransferase